MCSDYKIKHQNLTAYLPQMNGVVEATNKYQDHTEDD